MGKRSASGYYQYETMIDSNMILRREFLRGALEQAILGLLAKKPLHGYGLAQAMHQGKTALAAWR